MPAESSSATGYGLLLVPQPPAVRTIFMKEGGSKRLAFPHTLFGLFYFRSEKVQFHLKRLHVMFGQQPFTGDRTEKVFGLPLRNHDGAFATCFYHWDTEQTAEKFAKKIIGQYWMSPYAEYNDWASWWTKKYNSGNPSFLSRWEQATKDGDYDFAMRESLLQSDYTVNIGKLLDANKMHYAAGGVEILSWAREEIKEEPKSIRNVNSDITERAYRLWQAAGCPEGRAVEFWLIAQKGE